MRIAMKHWSWVLFGVLLASASAVAKPTALFYLGTDPDSVRSFLAHSKQIDLLVPGSLEADRSARPYLV
jgi:hypothetical protein